ncbi:MAG: Ni/Fe-hydrogenase, b-type cytochrome subunit [Gemmatimonadaceae bacterium]|nr:Ni/Fe-hydrogenase, b-type cytochrome subunit [Gemmatimonadaceae bacterium]
MTAPGGAATGRRRINLFGLGRPLSRERGNFTWVYLWSAPIRATHWIAAACVVVLIVTGFYIGRPYFMTSGEASAHFLMGRVRFIHFTAAAVLIMAGIVRVYWLFAGNQFERLPALFPVTPKNVHNMLRTAGAYLTFRPDKQPSLVGHDPLQQYAYTGLYFMALVMVVTGSTMYGQSNPGGIIFRAFAWVPLLLGGLQRVRLLHHVLAWAFIIYVVIHVYFTIRSDYVERVGRVSSIITGGRYISTDEPYEDYDINQVPAHQWPTPEHPNPKKEA